eukprot:365535-Chlamydomonas_euryale.AAC.80
MIASERRMKAFAPVAFLCDPKRTKAFRQLRWSRNTAVPSTSARGRLLYTTPFITYEGYSMAIRDPSWNSTKR